jgi:hypothetical protein
MERFLSFPNQINFQSILVKIIFLTVFIGIASILGILFISEKYAIFLITILWIGATSTVVFSIRHQLMILWIMLPFLDLFKRLAYYDSAANDTYVYLILLTSDLILIVIIIKDLLVQLRKPVSIKFSFIDISILLFFLISLSSALFLSNAPLIARLATAGNWVWPMVSFYLFGKYFNEKDRVLSLIKITIVLGVIVALYGIRQFFGGFLPFEEAWFLRSTTSENVASLQAYFVKRGVLRTFATMDSHSSYGIFLGISLLFAWIIRPIHRFSYSILIYVILSFGLVLSFTRFTYLLPLIAFGFVFLFYYRSIKPIINIHKYRRVMIILIAVVFSFFIFYVVMDLLYNYDIIPSFSNPYLNRIFGTGTLSARLRLNELSIPGNYLSLLGSGLASSSYFAAKFSFSSTDINFHNIFLDMLGSLGIIGLASFLFFLFFFIRHVLKLIKFDDDRISKRILIGLFSLILGMLMVGHFNGAVFYFGRALPIYFWGICGILAHYQLEMFKPAVQQSLELFTS